MKPWNLKTRLHSEALPHHSSLLPDGLVTELVQHGGQPVHRNGVSAKASVKILHLLHGEQMALRNQIVTGPCLQTVCEAVHHDVDLLIVRGDLRRSRTTSHDNKTTNVD